MYIILEQRCPGKLGLRLGILNEQSTKRQVAFSKLYRRRYLTAMETTQILENVLMITIREDAVDATSDPPTVYLEGLAKVRDQS